jgi:aryl-alcohol dehydrogenase-like predicted oxidoreductase
MTTRELGRSGLKVSAIGLGCMGMSQSYGPGDDDESIRTVHRALDLGITFFDTAAVYGAGANETLVGRALGARRRGIVLATKCGIVRGPDGKMSALDGSPREIAASCDASLKRLGTDHIDLFYLHRVDPATPIEDSVGAMAELVRAGKVRHLGLSEASSATLRRASRVHPIAALQSEYSLWCRDPEDGILATCRELGIGFVPFSPLGRGFLSGQVKMNDLSDADVRHTLPRFQGDNLPHNERLLQGLAEMASRKQCQPSQVAIAWVLAQGDDIVPIPGTKRVPYLESNVVAAGVTLTADDLQTLGTLFPRDAAAGERYQPDLMKWVDKSQI